MPPPTWSGWAWLTSTPRKPHPVLCENVQESPDVVCGVDDHRLFRLAVADQVAEVDHLAGERSAWAKSRPDRSWRK